MLLLRPEFFSEDGEEDMLGRVFLVKGRIERCKDFSQSKCFESNVICFLLLENFNSTRFESKH